MAKKKNKNTERTLDLLKMLGYKVGVVERWLSHAWHAKGRGVRKDLFGIIDIIAIAEGKTVGVQSTGQDFAGHDRKILTDERESSIAWLEAGNKLMLIAWRKLKRNNRLVWVPRIKEYTLKDFE